MCAITEQDEASKPATPWGLGGRGGAGRVLQGNHRIRRCIVPFLKIPNLFFFKLSSGIALLSHTSPFSDKAQNCLWGEGQDARNISLAAPISSAKLQTLTRRKVSVGFQISTTFPPLLSAVGDWEASLTGRDLLCVNKAAAL